VTGLRRTPPGAPRPNGCRRVRPSHAERPSGGAVFRNASENPCPRDANGHDESGGNVTQVRLLPGASTAMHPCGNGFKPWVRCVSRAGEDAVPVLSQDSPPLTKIGAGDSLIWGTPQSRGEPRGQGGHVQLGVGGRLRRGRE
jgi:hypothetical protein